jgi:hypothetical protein
LLFNRNLEDLKLKKFSENENKNDFIADSSLSKD